MSDNQWVIVSARTLEVGDIVRPINSCGPVVPVVRVEGRFFFVDLDDEKGDTLDRLPRRQVNALNPRSGKVPRMLRKGEKI